MILLARKLAAPCLGVGLLAGASAWANENFPSKPIRIVVGYSAGGAVDLIARSVGQRLSAQLGQPEVVDNKPGGGKNNAE